MKTILRLLSTVMLFSGVVVLAEPRVFTDTAGRTLSAEIVSATAESVTLKLDSGAVHAMPLSRLSVLDRDFVGSWLKSQPTAQAVPPAAVAKPDLKVEWTSERVGRKLRPTDEVDLKDFKQPTVEELIRSNGKAGGLHEDWVCHFRVTNLNRIQFTNLQLRYEIWLKREKKKKITETRIERGTVVVPMLDSFKTAMADTSAIKLWADAFQDYSTVKGSLGQSITVAGHKQLSIDEIAGVSVTVEHNGVQVHKFESPEVKNLVKRP